MVTSQNKKYIIFCFLNVVVCYLFLLNIDLTFLEYVRQLLAVEYSVIYFIKIIISCWVVFIVYFLLCRDVQKYHGLIIWFSLMCFNFIVCGFAILIGFPVGDSVDGGAALANYIGFGSFLGACFHALFFFSVFFHSVLYVMLGFRYFLSNR